MLFKTKKLLFITMILLTGCMFYGCVEEPTIEPVKTPYAVLRIGNFTHNVQDMSVTVAGKTYDLTNKAVTPFFDITPGNVPFVVTSQGKTIFEKEIDLSSYQEMSLLFIGDYSTVDTMNTFQTVRIDEGLVYVYNAPPEGQATLTFAGMLLNDMQPFPPKLVPFLDVKIGDDLMIVSLESKQVIAKNYSNVGSKSIDFSIYNGGNPISKANANVDIKANKRYLVVLSGNASEIYTPTVIETDPLPVRTK